MLNVVEPGLLTTVQDLGRRHWYHIGMPPAGALDDFAFRVGNLLVGNPEDAAGLEVTYAGPTLDAEADGMVAVTGADIDFTINGRPAAQWRAHALRAGDRLGLGGVRTGARAYVCLAGGITVPERLGSRATYMLGRFGGMDGRKLAAGDRLPLGTPITPPDALLGRTFNPALIPIPQKQLDVRVVMGMCNHRVTPDSLAEFLRADWEVSTEADRIGYRLKGPTFAFNAGEQPFGAGADPSNVVDLGYPIGSIQIPGGLEAIVLLNDAVTGGGYTTIGTVVKADLDLIAQTSPGCRIRFHEVGINGALQARREREARLDRIRMELGLFDRTATLGQ